MRFSRSLSCVLAVVFASVSFAAPTDQWGTEFWFAVPRINSPAHSIINRSERQKPANLPRILAATRDLAKISGIIIRS